MKDEVVKKETMTQENLISLDLAEQLYNAGVKQESKWYWLYDESGKFWDCVTDSDMYSYKPKKKLRAYSAFTISKLKE